MIPTSAARRSLLLAALCTPVAALAQQAGKRPAVLVEVWKDPNCGCCKDWVSHLEANGFRVKVNDTGNSAMRAKLGMPEKLGSCHTGLVGGYAVEGHVPAPDIRRLLQEKPQAVGLTVPGMPVGSPGMDGEAYGNRRDPFDVLLVGKSGDTRVYASYNKAAAAASPLAQAELADGEVRRVDRAIGKITLRHGDIRSLDMPPMTMVFSVRDKSLLDNVKAGDKVKFTASKDAKGVLVITSIEAQK